MFSFCVSTENETENENAKSFSAENESDRNHKNSIFGTENENEIRSDSNHDKVADHGGGR